MSHGRPADGTGDRLGDEVAGIELAGSFSVTHSLSLSLPLSFIAHAVGLRAIRLVLHPAVEEI